MSVLEELSNSIDRLAKSAGSSVVRLGGGWRSGVGVVIADGFVLTNAHNLADEPVPVRFTDGRRAEGRTAGVDIDGDLAVVAVDTAGAPALEWSPLAPAVGNVVFAVTPGESGPRVTLGTISSVAQAFRGPRGRPIAGAIEHTAPLVRGSSGGPLLDGEGRIVGINTNRLGGGFYLALPADESLRERVETLKGGESVERVRLGVGIAPSHAARRLRRAVGLPERDGVLVRMVEEGSPADRAGIEQGDLIVAADDRPLRRGDDLYAALADVRPGSSLRLQLVRGTDERSVQVSFGSAAGPTGDPVH
jgi:serine protease Do